MTADHAGQTGGELDVHPANPLEWLQMVQAGRVWCSHCGEPTPCAAKVAAHEAADSHRQYCIPVGSCYLTCQPIPSRPVPFPGQAAREELTPAPQNVKSGPGNSRGREQAREAAVEAVARWLAEWRFGQGMSHVVDEPSDGVDQSIRKLVMRLGDELLSLPAVAALSAAPGQEQCNPCLRQVRAGRDDLDMETAWDDLDDPGQEQP